MTAVPGALLPCPRRAAARQDHQSVVPHLAADPRWPGGQIAVMRHTLVDEKRWLETTPVPAGAELLHAAGRPRGPAAPAPAQPLPAGGSHRHHSRSGWCDRQPRGLFCCPHALLGYPHGRCRSNPRKVPDLTSLQVEAVVVMALAWWLILGRADLLQTIGARRKDAPPHRWSRILSRRHNHVELVDHLLRSRDVGAAGCRRGGCGGAD
jgi:hypothetical protein